MVMNNSLARDRKRGDRRCIVVFWMVASLLLSTALVDAQTYGSRLGTVKRGGKVSFDPTGPGVLFDALDPTVRKWFIPQELYSEYGWKQWEYSNYARETYQRYVSTSIEGFYFTIYSATSSIAAGSYSTGARKTRSPLVRRCLKTAALDLGSTTW